jgi:enoyl-CoA hydratase/carnithine racemase
MDNLILTEENHGVFTITLNRFDKKNALNTEMYQQLCQHFSDAKLNNAIHCVLIKGNESCFCAGNDLQDFIACADDDDLAALDFVKILADFTKPIVAAVAGPAIGIGTTLLLHCDMIIAADNAKFKLPFTQLGLCPEAGSSLLLPLKIGVNRAFELLVLGTSFNANQALQFGVVNQVCSASELMAIANKIALSIAQLPTDAVMTSRKLIKSATHKVLSQVIEDEGNEFSRLVKTPDCKKIMSHFFK